MKKSKLIMAICCLIALVATVTVSFAVWDTLGANDQSISASFGQNVEVEIINHKAFTNANMNLVPQEAICGSRDTTLYKNAQFTVKFKDYSGKSTLFFTVQVITDGDVNVSRYFDINLNTLTEGASVELDQDKSSIGVFEGIMQIPGSMVQEDVKVAGEALFNMDMQFKSDAVDIDGISQIIGRSFRIKIDIFARKA